MCAVPRGNCANVSQSLIEGWRCAHLPILFLQALIQIKNATCFIYSIGRQG